MFKEILTNVYGASDLTKGPNSHGYIITCEIDIYPA